MKTILGITDGDDGGAALAVDGRLVAAVNEERLNRLKMSIGFPRLAVQQVLKLGGCEPGDVDQVAVAAFSERFRPECIPNRGWFREPSSVDRIRNNVSSALARPLGGLRSARKVYGAIKRLTLGRRRAGVRRLLADLGIRAPIRYHDHHRCHAIAAFDASGFDDAVSISLDGGGDGCSSHVYALNRQGEELLERLESFDSIGNYYAYVTHLCGFRASIHEGKITGLSARGEPLYREIFGRLIEYHDGRIRNVGKLFYRGALQALAGLLPEDWERADLAASIQQHLEQVAVSFVKYWIRRSGKSKVCLSGGVFANVLLNQRISDLPECEAVFVFPAMGDGGLAAGAIYSERRQSNGQIGPLQSDCSMPHVYLGPSFREEQLERALRGSGLGYERYEAIERVVARLLEEGRVVARFDGAMEFGPRALGNRSILYRADDPSVNQWLNQRLNRTEFMPFAPACLAGEEQRLFHWNSAAARSARFMTITLDCSEWMKRHCPAVVHIDGTARPQIVDRATNPGFHEILRRYHELTGVPVVVNTSFNMHEEPIVCTPADAIRAYRLGRLDNLALGPFLLGPPPHNEDD